MTMNIPFDELNKDQWREMFRELQPGLTDAGFDRIWGEFWTELNQAKLRRAVSDASKFLKPKEAAQFIGVSYRTLAKWRCNKTGNLPFYRLGHRRIFYSVADLTAWAASNRVTPEMQRAVPQYAEACGAKGEEGVLNKGSIPSLLPVREK